MTMRRRAFLTAAAVGAVGTAAGATYGYENDSSYGRLRPSVSVGIGRGEAASFSLVWLPRQGREQSPPIKARLVLFDLAGKVLVEKQFVIPPFTGAAVDYELPKGISRQQGFGYAYIDGLNPELAEEIFAGVEVYDVSSGRRNFEAVPGLP